ncbi:hypothetical protein Tco_0221486 [Tanacetum coccineum]
MKLRLKANQAQSLNSQNVAFISSNDTSSTNEADNTAHDVPAARSKGQASSSTYADDVMFSFFVNQSNSPQLDNEDLEQIDTDDLEEMDLKWQVAMLTMRVKRFLKKTGRNLRSFMESRMQRPYGKQSRPETPVNALVVQDGICGYDRSYQDKEGPTDFALMAHSSSGSSSSSRSNTEVENCSKECLESYQSLQKQFDQQRDVRDNSITELKNQLAEALREKDDLKLKLEKFETSSMKLTKLINSQISVNNKSGVGFNSQMNENELHDCHLNKSEVFESALDSSVNEIKEANNQVNDRPDLSFAGLYDSVYKTNASETISSVPIIESTASKSSKDSLEQPKDVRPSAPIIEEWEFDSDDDCVIRPSFEQNKPSYAKINFVKSDKNTRKSVIEQHTYRQAENLRKSQSPRVDKRNWNGIMTQKLGDGFKFNKKACLVCGSLNHLIKDCNFYENKMVGKYVLNNMGRVTAVATKSGLVPVNAAKQSSPRAVASISTARHVNIVALKQKVNATSPTKYSYFKAHSPLRRPFNQKSAAKANNFNKKVYTAKVNNVTTAGPEVVVSTAKGKRENDIKSSACWIWRPTRKGNPQYALRDQGIFDSGCSRYMTRNKSYLTDYQDIDGGFVAFARSPKGGKITRKGKIRTGKLDFEDVYFVKELKFNLFSVSQMCDKKNSVLFTEIECLVLSPDFKLLDGSQVLLKVPR